MLLCGIYAQGSQAAVEYVTSVERLADLRLLRTSVENYVPGKASLLSTRAIPE